MVKSSRPRGGFATEAQKQATYENLALGQLHRLQTLFNKSGHYDFQQRARELEELFRAKTNRKEKD